jgi:NAD(P)-dependent dehydrogenase (short-subunit alcohol dehydrogenase family)
MAKHAHDVAVLDRDGDRVGVVTALRAAGHDAVGVRAEVSIDSKLNRAVLVSESTLGRLDILVHNAGRDAPSVQMATDEFALSWPLTSAGPRLT